jgi:ABC-type proline/glycine betaine transport system substrate-binding protein
MIMVLRILLALVAAALITMGGCSKKSEPTAPAEVKVTEENLDSELDKLEAQIEADIAAEE